MVLQLAVLRGKERVVLTECCTDFLFLVVMPFAPSSFLFLAAMPGAPSSGS